MEGDDAERHCERCDSTVHDIASLTPSEVLSLMDGPAKTCVRLHRRADGSVRTASPRRRRLRVLGAAAGVALSGAAAWTATTWPDATLLSPDRIASPYQGQMLLGLVFESPEPEPRVWSPSGEDLAVRPGDWSPSKKDSDALVSEARSRTESLDELLQGSVSGPEIRAEETDLDPHGSEDPE